MVKSSLHSRTRFSTAARLPKDPQPTIQPGPPVLAEPSQLLLESTPATTFTEIGSFDLVRKFVEHVVENAGRALGHGGSAPCEIDWAVVEASTSDCLTLEQAIGRAVVVADQISRGVFDGSHSADLPPYFDANDPFFAFSVADIAPDFGDESRYRERVVRKVAGIFGTRRKLAATSISLILILFSAAIYQVAHQGPSSPAPYQGQANPAVTGNAQLVRDARSSAAAVSLTASPSPATTTPAAAPPSLPIRRRYALTRYLDSHRIGLSIKVPGSMSTSFRRSPTSVSM